jgi:N-acetylglucosamine-6-phosphate deacetylase
VKAFKNVKLITKTGILEHKTVIFDSNIRAITDEDRLESGITVIDGKGLYMAPGFIDLHIHGCAGYDSMDEDPRALTEISKNIVKTGVTAFLPTTMTMDWSKITRALEQIRRQTNQPMNRPTGAQILGCHLEGPFLSKKYAGAQDATHIIDPSFVKIQPYIDLIRIITLAPENTGSIEFIRDCRKHNIIISIGHSDASLDEAAAAIATGASMITHTFNAMSPMHHRNPGVVAAAMLHDVTCEIIADNVHVHPRIQQLLLKTKGTAQIVLITDAMRACLLQDGEYDLGGQLVKVSGNEARLDSGQLAGSVLTMNRALKNFMMNTGITVWEAVLMASSNPANELGLNNKGSIEPGKAADLVLFDPDFNIMMTFIEGHLVYRRD